MGTKEQIQVQLDKKADRNKSNDMKVDSVIGQFLKFYLSNPGVVDMTDTSNNEWDALRLQIIRRLFWV